VEGGNLGALLARLRRYWLLVLAVTAVAVLGGLAATATASTSYVGRTSTIVSSNDRSPDQDAVLVQGYVAYFNDSAYQRELSERAGVPDDVTLEAEAAAASPILIISATTSDPQTAQAYAIQVADVFREDINRVRAERRAEQLSTLQDQLDTALNSDAPNAGAVVSDLQDRIEQIESDRVNVLEELQAEGGVSVQEPSLLRNVLPAAAGGLLLGLLGAFAVGGLSRRLQSGRDVADKVGIPTLVEIPRLHGSAAGVLKEQRLGHLANIVRARLSGPSVVAVAQPDAGVASSFVALELARAWARQGHPTVLFSADVGSVRDGAEVVGPQVLPGTVPGLSLVRLAPRSADGAPILSVSELNELLRRETLAGRYVVVDIPAVVQSAAGQALCQAADQTILVVDSMVTRVPVAREAVAVLRQMSAVLLGAVVAAAGEAEREEVAAELERPASPLDSATPEERSGDAEGVDDSGPPDLLPVETTPSRGGRQDTSTGPR
jgi:capsular polysaccharide biosynthesis protein